MARITRKFKKYSGESRKPDSEKSALIESFLGNRVLVILGEPGSGKTTTLNYASGIEEDSLFFRIGEFLADEPNKELKGKTLYLDGLDEVRSRIHGLDVMDALVARLKSLNCPKVRLSCRTADWHGAQDLKALSSISEGQEIVQLHLMPLSEEDYGKMVPDAEEFVCQAEFQGLADFLTNPQDFLLLHDFYSRIGSWPKNRSELMEGACKLLLNELNKGHYEATDDWVTDTQLISSSDYLAAILILSNVSGIATNRLRSSKSYPNIHQFEGDLFAMKVATGRRVFKPVNDGVIEPKHRKIAEYMTARCLARRVRKGLPLSRVMALLTGNDGETSPDLRGVYAWLVTELAGMSQLIISNDPYGAIIYGDTYSWTPNTKKLAFQALVQLAEKDPWFRQQDQSQNVLGGLSDKSLVPEFKKVLKSDSEDNHLLGLVIDILANGHPIPELSDSLIEFIYSDDRSQYWRARAISSFVKSSPDRIQEILKFGNSLKKKKFKDKDQYLVGSLLKNLYPEYIKPEDIAGYLVVPSGHVIGAYHYFLGYEIFENSNTEHLLGMANGLINSDNDSVSSSDFSIKRFKGKLVSHLLLSQIEKAPEDILNWFLLSTDKHGRSEIDRDEAKEISKWLQAHDDIYFELFLLFKDLERYRDYNGFQIWWRFHDLTAGTRTPHSFYEKLYAFLVKQRLIRKNSKLFELIAHLTMTTDPSDVSVTLEELESLSARSKTWKKILIEASVCSLDDWRHDDAKERLARLEEEKEQKKRNIAELRVIKTRILSGEALSELEHFARVYMAGYSDVDPKISGEDRVREIVGKEISDWILAGIVNAIKNEIFHSVEEIAKTSANNKSFVRSYLIFAALEIIHSKGEEQLLELDDQTIRVSIAYYTANFSSQVPDWLIVFLRKRTELVKSTFIEFWCVQLDSGASSLTGFYLYEFDNPLEKTIRDAAYELAKKYPRVESSLLEIFLLFLIRGGESASTLDLVKKAVSNRKLPMAQKIMWVSLGFSFDVQAYKGRLESLLSKSDENKWYGKRILLFDVVNRDSEGNYKRSATYRQHVIAILGPKFQNVPRSQSVGVRWVGIRDESTASEEIKGVIETFSNDSSVQAKESIENLLKDRRLKRWESDLQFVQANQLRALKRASYTYPDVSKVVATLSNSEPANTSDLKAIIIETLREINSEIRDGNTDSYKAFWNTDSFGRAGGTHVDENTARDRLLEFMRPKLRHLELIAEPEVRYADDKRADIAVYSKAMKLPIEIKRDDHSELWVAMSSQLEERYTRDPSSEGNGIYLVFWFDGLGMAKPKVGLRPKSADELKDALDRHLPESAQGLIEIIVIDVSIPKGRRTKKRTPTKKRRITKNTAPKKMRPGKRKIATAGPSIGKRLVSKNKVAKKKRASKKN